MKKGNSICKLNKIVRHNSRTWLATGHYFYRNAHDIAAETESAMKQIYVHFFPVFTFISNLA